MKVTLESTSKTTQLVRNGVEIPARIWEGFTEKGIPCYAFMTLIAVSEQDDTVEFERDLQEQRALSAEIDRVIPMRLIL